MGRRRDGQSPFMVGRAVANKRAALGQGTGGSTGSSAIRGSMGPLGGPMDGPVAVQQPNPVDRQAAIEARLLAAKSATGQSANINGTTNAMSTAVGRQVAPTTPMRRGK